MRYALILWLSCLSLVAQSPLGTGSGIEWSRNIIPDLTPLLPSGKYVWFNWQDLSSSPVSIWTDRIQGWTAVQATGGNQPTWDSTNGVQFNGTSSFMTSTNFSPGNDEAVLVIGQFDDAGTGHQMLSGGNVSAGTYIGIATVAGALRDNSGGDSATKPITTIIYDFIAVKTNSPNAYQFYTNGIASQFANSGAPWNGSSGISRLGSTTTPDNFFKGKIWEIIVWTNQTWNSLTVSNVHYYAVHNTPNLITAQPSGIVDLAANNHALTVSAISGSAYQWRKAGANIAGATSSSLTMASTADSGYYDVVVSALGRFQISSTVSNAIVTTATVSNWCVMVTTNGGTFPSLPTVSAVDTFYNGLVTDGIDTKMIAVNCMIPDNLTACLTPLVKGAGSNPWVNHNFVSGDLSVNGLKGNGSTKYLDTGLLASTAFSANDNGNARYLYTTNTANEIDGGEQSFPNSYFMTVNNTLVAAAMYNQTVGQGYVSGSTIAPGTGFYSCQRTSSSAAAIYFGYSGQSHTSLASIATSGGTLAAFNYYLFVLNNAGTPFSFSDATISFEAYTKGLNSTQDANLFSRVQTMRTSLGGGFR